jgi:hypothetical protein
MEEKDPCDGCIEDIDQCTIHYVNKQEKCPCKECLLKPMCRNPCKAFDQLWNEADYYSWG